MPGGTGTTGVSALVVGAVAVSLPPVEGAVYGAVGAMIGAMSMLMTLVSASEKPTRWQWWQTGFRGALSIAIGATAAAFFGPGIASLLDWSASSDQTRLLELAIGLLAWRLVPVVIERAAHEAKERGRS